MTISETKQKGQPEFRERACSFALVVAVGLAYCEEDEVDIGSTTRSGSYQKKQGPSKISTRVTATDVKP